VHLVEKEPELGGNLRSVFTASNGKDPQQVLARLVAQVAADEAIMLHLSSQVAGSSGFMGNFLTVVQHKDGRRQEIRHGATIVAIGAQEYRGPEYGYGQHARIVTQQEFEALLAEPESVCQDLKSVAMIQCVGPAEQFCSRICCTVALKNALALKARNPGVQAVVLYKDIRSYGFKERLYTQAREQGILFVRYSDQRKPEVTVGDDASLSVQVWDPILQRPLELHPDYLVLSMPAVPREEAAGVAALFKVPVDSDGFFQEAHVKLRPVDFTTDGVFMAGMAHYPKLLDETMIQAQAAAARAARILSQETLTAGGRVAVVDEALCTGCLTCVRVCPFGVPVIRPNLSGVGGILGAAHIETAVCRGCGLCVAECPARAIQLQHFTDAQMTAKVRALTERPAGFVPLSEIGESVPVT
jgi:heterodisulfide reductase subunit A-like polyferredoxin